MESFEPVVVAFCCHYCAYTAADLAGTMRLQYPSNIRIIRIPCTGKVDVRFLLEAFEKGADGVFVAGCLEGDCHFLTGNLRAKKRVKLAKQILEEAGIGGDRLEMFNMSAAMGPRFAQVAAEMTERIRSLGPNPIKKTQSAERKAQSEENRRPSAKQEKEKQSAEHITQSAKR